MPIRTRQLILNEVVRFEHFPNVVETGSHAYQQSMCTDGFGCRFRECCDGNTVVVGAGCTLRQLSEKRVAHVAQFQQA